MNTPTEISKYVPLKTVVSYFLDQYDKSFGDFDKYWIISFRGMIAMGFNISWEAKTVRLPVLPNKTVPFPPDYVEWSKIGVMNQNGETSTLKVNRSLSKLKSNNPDRLSYLTPDVTDSWLENFPFPFFVNYYVNGNYTPLFGIGSGLIQYGECTIDNVNRLIVLSPDYPFQDVLLEYIFSPQKDNDYEIETCLQEALITFLAWKSRPPMASENEFYARLKEGRRSLKPMKLQEINQAIRESFGYKLKS